MFNFLKIFKSKKEDNDFEYSDEFSYVNFFKRPSNFKIEPKKSKVN